MATDKFHEWHKPMFGRQDDENAGSGERRTTSWRRTKMLPGAALDGLAHRTAMFDAFRKGRRTDESVVSLEVV